MPVLDHRPRSVAELIDAAIALVRRDFARYCLVVAVGVAPWQVAQLAAVHATGLDLSGQATPDLVGLGGVGLLAVLFFSFIEAALAVAVGQAYEGSAPDVGHALRRGLRRWPSVLLATILKYLLIFAAATLGIMLAGMVTAIVMLAAGRAEPSDPVMIGMMFVTMLLGAALALPFVGRYAAVPMTAALEPLGPIAALRRSRELTRGLWKHAVGVSALAWLILVLPMVITSSLLGVLPVPQVVEQAVGIVVRVVLTPAYVATLALLYYDLRIRKEGFDLELMASQLEPAVPDAGPDIRAIGGA